MKQTGWEQTVSTKRAVRFARRVFIFVLAGTILLGCGMTEPEQGNDSTKYVVEYDDAGNVVKETYYNPDGSWTETKYDSAGNRIWETYHEVDGKSYEYEYDSDGNTKKYTRCNADGSLIDWCEYEYDSVGNVKQTAYNSDGIKESLYEFKQNEPDKVKQTYYEPDGSIIWISEVEYYNTGGLKKEIRYYPDNNSTTIWEWSSDGTLTRDEEYEGNRLE